MYICICVYISMSLCCTFLCMRRLGMDTAGFEPAEGGEVTVKNHAFGTWSAPPLAEARNNSS